MGLTARARLVRLLSSGVQPLQVPGLRFLLPMRLLHAPSFPLPLVLLIVGPCRGLLLPRLQEPADARGETWPILGWLIPSAAILSLPSLILGDTF